MSLIFIFIFDELIMFAILQHGSNNTEAKNLFHITDIGTLPPSDYSEFEKFRKRYYQKKQTITWMIHPKFFKT